MKFESLRDVLSDSLRDLYNAETQLVKALPKMAKAASSEELQTAFNHHFEETRGHVDRLERACELLGVKAKGKTCQAMKGLVEEGSDIIDMDGNAMAKDAALINAAQKVEHYEIAGYGTARTFAEVLGEKEVVELLQATLNEERAADEKLTQVAVSDLNEEAAEGDEEEGEMAKTAGRHALAGHH